jgi:hypothetical protein
VLEVQASDCAGELKMAMDRRSFFGRLFGAAVAAPVLANELAKVPAPVPVAPMPAAPAPAGMGDFMARSFSVPCQSYCITMRLPNNMAMADLDWSSAPIFLANGALTLDIESVPVQRGGFGQHGRT